jgi:hypothetical protein
MFHVVILQNQIRFATIYMGSPYVVSRFNYNTTGGSSLMNLANTIFQLHLFAFISKSWKNIIYIPKHYVIPIIFPKGRHLVYLLRFVNILSRLFIWLQCLGTKQPLVGYSKSFLTLDVVITPLLIIFDSMNMHEMYLIVFFYIFQWNICGIHNEFFTHLHPQCVLIPRSCVILFPQMS